MSLDLHQECLSRLKSSLADQLRHVKVCHATFLAPESSLYLFIAQQTLPTTGKLHARLKKMVSEAPLVDFVSGTLARELYETRDYNAGEGPVLLSSLPEYSDLGALADRFVAAFDSLPWQYTATFALPALFSELFCQSIGSFEISEAVSLDAGDSTFAETFPSTSGIDKRDSSIKRRGLLSAFAPNGDRVWEPNTAYLQVRVDGFVGKFTNTEPLRTALAALRSFLGLGLAVRLFEHSSAYRAYPPKERAYIHRRVDDSWIIEETHDLESRHSETIHDLKLHNLNGSLDTEDKRVSWANNQLASISTVFSAEERARNIALGAQWLFDSYCGTDQLLQFVQATIVVEILLGEKGASDLTGLGELLSNRCAYLIATSHAQRQDLLRDFRRIYDVRSKIVHRGKSQLEVEEWTLFNKLRWMCRRIIQEEIELLKKDLDKDA